MTQTRTVQIERLESYGSRWMELWGLPVDGVVYPNYIVAYSDDPTVWDTLRRAQLGSGQVVVDLVNGDKWPRIVGVEEVERGHGPVDRAIQR